jgi:hypothetical protein
MGSIVLIRNMNCVKISKGLKSDCNINDSVIHLTYKTNNTQNDQGISPCAETYRDYKHTYQMNVDFWLCMCILKRYIEVIQDTGTMQMLSKWVVWGI